MHAAFGLAGPTSRMGKVCKGNEGLISIAKHSKVPKRPSIKVVIIYGPCLVAGRAGARSGMVFVRSLPS